MKQTEWKSQTIELNALPEPMFAIYDSERNVVVLDAQKLSQSILEKSSRVFVLRRGDKQRVEEENRLYLGKPTRFEWKNGQMMGEVIVQYGKNRCRMSFVWREDERGNLRPVDPFIVKGALDLECPQCNRKNEPILLARARAAPPRPPILFWYDDDGSGCGSRRYFYCCPDCKIHYTSWGQHADRNSERMRIFRNCTQNGDHQSERHEFEKTIIVK